MNFDPLHLSYLFERLPSSMRAYLPPGDNYAMLPATLKRLHRTVVSLKPRYLIELGSGLSTFVIIDALLRQQTKADLFTFEHDPRWFHATFADVAHPPRQLDEKIRIEDHYWFRVENVDIHPSRYDLNEATGFYDLMVQPELYDLIVVDGPPSYVGPLARQGAFTELAQVAREECVWFIDDYQRPGEQAMVRNWVGAHPEYLVWEDPWWESAKTKHAIALVGKKLPRFCHVS